jgi:REP element-mobilizing transposase RayT
MFIVFSSSSKNIAFSDLIGRLKGASSKRLKEQGLHGFGWQNGYGAFSVSESNVESVTAYIVNQVEHHKKVSYQEEIREILKSHKVAFDERYVWD